MENKQLLVNAKQLGPILKELLEHLGSGNGRLAVIVINLAISILNKIKKQLKDSRHES